MKTTKKPAAYKYLQKWSAKSSIIKLTLLKNNKKNINKIKINKL